MESNIAKRIDKIILIALVIFMLMPSEISIFNISILKIETILISIIIVYLFFIKRESVKEAIKNKFIIRNFVFASSIALSIIVNHDGNVILDNTETTKTQVLKESTAWLMGNVLHNVLLDGTLHGLHVGDNYISAKSGTTQSDRDKWIVGYSKSVTVGIWVGNDKNTTTTTTTSDTNKPHQTIRNSSRRYMGRGNQKSL